MEKRLRVSDPQGRYPDSYQAILPVVDMPKAGIVFPGSEFLQALDDLDTGATFDFAVNLVTLSREMEFVRTTAPKATSTTNSPSAATSATATPN